MHYRRIISLYNKSKLIVNKIKTYITEESTIGLFVEIFVILFFILSLIALLSTKNL